MKGELLLETKMAAEGSGPGMAASLPMGFRGITIMTPNIATGVAGFIMPGSMVDVFLTVSGDVAVDGGGTTILLLQRVKVLAVDQRRIAGPQDSKADNKTDAKDMRSVTLQVSAKDAAKLDLGQNKGTLRLVLRNPNDTKDEEFDPTTLLGLRFNRDLQTPEPPPVRSERSKQAKASPVPSQPQRKAPLRVSIRGGSQGAWVYFDSAAVDTGNSRDVAPAPGQ